LLKTNSLKQILVTFNQATLPVSAKEHKAKVGPIKQKSYNKSYEEMILSVFQAVLLITFYLESARK